MMKIYRGRRSPEGVEVTVDGAPLDPRLELRTFSESGFEWGYEGGGPSQLALAILADHFGDDRRAMSHYRDFRVAVIAAIRDDEWTLDSHAIATGLSGVVRVPMTLDELLGKVRGE